MNGVRSLSPAHTRSISMSIGNQYQYKCVVKFNLSDLFSGSVSEIMKTVELEKVTFNLNAVTRITNLYLAIQMF